MSMRKMLRHHGAAIWALSGLVALTFTAVPALAQNDQWDDYEYEPDEGLHEEEWYDPSDWFESDNDGIDYEYDYDPYYTNYDYYNEYGYDYDPYAYGWYDDYGYDYDPYAHDWYAAYYQYEGQNRERNRNAARYDRGERDRRSGERYTRENRRSRSGQSRRQQQRTAQFGHHFKGDLVKTRTVNLFGDQHVLAKIRKSDGKTCVVDLGPKKKVAKLDLQKGDTLRIDGRRGMLAAGRIRANDETVTVDRRWAGDRSNHPYRTSGTVDNLRTRKVSGEKKVIAYLEGPDGWLQRVNLGSKQHLRNEGLNIEEGDRIKVHGYRGHMGGSAMVFANRIKTVGDQQERHSRKRHRNQQRFAGEVTDTWTEMRDGDRYMFATIELDNGEAIDVKLGTRNELRRFDINQGDDIRIRGKKQRDKNGEACVVASDLRVNGGPWKTID